MNQTRDSARPARCLLVLVSVSTGALALGSLLLPDVLALGRAIRTGTLAGEPFHVVLVQVCEVAIGGCAVWLWLGTAVVAADAARGLRARPRGVPVAVRRWVLAACGLALVGGLAAPAHAGDESGTRLDGLPLPDRATTTTYVSRVFARAAHQEHARRDPRPPTTVVFVQPGDTLWAIARAALPPRAGDGAVARRVQAIHRANRSVIGADPDLIRPRQRLRVPRHTTIREEHR